MHLIACLILKIAQDNQMLKIQKLRNSSLFVLLAVFSLLAIVPLWRLLYVEVKLTVHECDTHVYEFVHEMAELDADRSLGSTSTSKGSASKMADVGVDIGFQDRALSNGAGQESSKRGGSKRVEPSFGAKALALHLLLGQSPHASALHRVLCSAATATTSASATVFEVDQTMPTSALKNAQTFLCPQDLSADVSAKQHSTSNLVFNFLDAGLKTIHRFRTRKVWFNS